MQAVFAASLFYRLIADAVVVLHIAYMLVVVLGLPAIWWGIARKQAWIRNVWLRGEHLAMILIVVGETWAGITCPLTTWENWLRDAAGQQAYRGAFLANLVHDLLFYDAEPWVFAVIYTVFGLLVAGSFVLAPPQWSRQSQKSKQVVR